MGLAAQVKARFPDLLSVENDGATYTYKNLFKIKFNVPGDVTSLHMSATIADAYMRAEQREFGKMEGLKKILMSTMSRSCFLLYRILRVTCVIVGCVGMIVDICSKSCGRLRKDLCEKCELFGISKMGNVPELRDRLFLHFLQNATEENLLGLPAYQAEADALPHESDGAAGIEDSGKDAHVPLSETKEDAAVPEAPEKALSGKPETPRGSGFPISPETDMPATEALLKHVFPNSNIYWMIQYIHGFGGKHSIVDCFVWTTTPSSHAQVAQKFPHIKVNKFSCRVSIHGFTKIFKGQHRTVLQHAELADVYYQAGSRYWTELSAMSKTLDMYLQAFSFILGDGQVV